MIARIIRYGRLIKQRFEAKAEYKKLLFQSKDVSRAFEFVFNKHLLILNEKTTSTNYDRHYILHLAWASRILASNKPSLHVDISSSLHFSTMMSTHFPMEFYDYRPANIDLPDYKSGHIDLTEMSFADNSILSLSCMHVVEHVGLGRYGDPIDFDGDLKAMKELQRVLKPGGFLLFVTPVGKSKIIFNRHRIYAYQQIMAAFNELRLVEFTLIPENGEQGDLLKDPDMTLVESQDYGCGCWLFTKD